MAETEESELWGRTSLILIILGLVAILVKVIKRV